MNNSIDRQLAIDTAIDAVDSWDGGCNKEREKIIREALEKLPSAEPETSLMTVKSTLEPDEIEKVARKIKDAPVMVLSSTYSDVDMALKLNKAYDDGYETGYLQGKYDWIAKKKGRWNFIGDQMFECTKCGVCYTQSQFNQMRVRITDSVLPNFCPNCGADMREDQDGRDN